MDAIDFYSQTARAFHESYRNDANRFERIRVFEEFLNRYAAGASFAYDVGCGTGILASEMARRGIETIGIDGAAGMLSIAENSARELGLSNLRFQQERLPIANVTSFRKADIIISSSTIEYLDSVPESLLFIRNLLKDTGVVIFSVSNRDAISRKVIRCLYRLTRQPRYLRFLRHFMDLQSLKGALTTSGLTYLEHAYFGRADRINRFLRQFVPLRFASNMIIVAAQRSNTK